VTDFIFLFPLRSGAIGLEPKIEEVFFNKFFISDLKEDSILLYNTSKSGPPKHSRISLSNGVRIGTVPPFLLSGAEEESGTCYSSEHNGLEPIDEED
jgi:hypothetical protein